MVTMLVTLLAAGSRVGVALGRWRRGGGRHAGGRQRAAGLFHPERSGPVFSDLEQARPGRDEPVCPATSARARPRSESGRSLAERSTEELGGALGTPSQQHSP
jgi:hypothetical protein